MRPIIEEAKVTTIAKKVPYVKVPPSIRKAIGEEVFLVSHPGINAYIVVRKDDIETLQWAVNVLNAKASEQSKDVGGDVD